MGKVTEIVKSTPVRSLDIVVKGDSPFIIPIFKHEDEYWNWEGWNLRGWGPVAIGMMFNASFFSAAHFMGRKEDFIGAVLINMASIEGELTPRESFLCLGGAVTTDIIVRKQYVDWKGNLSVSLSSNVVTEKDVRALLSIAGTCIGVGMWRPEKDGNFGRFHVV